MLKIILLGLCVSIVSVFIRQYQHSFVIIVELAFAAVVLVLIADKALDTVGKLFEIFNTDYNFEKVFSSIFKGALVCISTKLACDVSKDSGNTVVADIIEFSGRIMLLIIAFPFIESVIKTAVSFVV